MGFVPGAAVLEPFDTYSTDQFVCLKSARVLKQVARYMALN